MIWGQKRTWHCLSTAVTPLSSHSECLVIKTSTKVNDTKRNVTASAIVTGEVRDEQLEENTSCVWPFFLDQSRVTCYSIQLCPANHSYLHIEFMVTRSSSCLHSMAMKSLSRYPRNRFSPTPISLPELPELHCRLVWILWVQCLH